MDSKMVIKITDFG